MGRKLLLEKPVKRIVSLVPSQTEFLFHLGLDEEVVGLTKFCIHPEHGWRSKKRVGGTKNVNVEKVRALNPELIIGNKEENLQENIADLEQIAPVWMSDIQSLEDAYDMMLQLGEILDKTAEAEKIVEEIRGRFQNLVPLHEPHKVLYFIWKNPWMTAGRDTFIHHLLEICGFQNAVLDSRYPIHHHVIEGVDLILLSSEPYPFKEKDVFDLKEMYPKAKILLVDGEMFSWYGSRLLKSPQYFQYLLNKIQRD